MRRSTFLALLSTALLGLHQGRAWSQDNPSAPANAPVKHVVGRFENVKLTGDPATMSVNVDNEGSVTMVIERKDMSPQARHLLGHLHANNRIRVTLHQYQPDSEWRVTDVKVLTHGALRRDD